MITARRLYTYAVLMLVFVVVAYVRRPEGGWGRFDLLVPAASALLVALVAGLAGATTRWPHAALLAQRIGLTLPLVLAAVLCLRAIRLDDTSDRFREATRAYLESSGADADAASLRAYLAQRGLPPNDPDFLAFTCWFMAASSALTLGVLHLERLRTDRS